jgi:hypothetical protein
MKYVTNSFDSVYFSVIRKEVATPSLLQEAKYMQDKQFLDYLLARAKPLTGTSHYMWLFPNKIQVIIELLFTKKSLQGDVPDLLSLIMFAGLESNEEEYFKNQIIQHRQYVSQTATKPKKRNQIYESQQNLSDLLFGITLDDVSHMSLMSTTFHS